MLLRLCSLLDARHDLAFAGLRNLFKCFSLELVNDLLDGRNTGCNMTLGRHARAQSEAAIANRTERRGDDPTDQIAREQLTLALQPHHASRSSALGRKFCPRAV